MALVLGLASCTPPAPADVSIERRELAIELLADGSARVRDALTVGVNDAPVDTFRRIIPAIRTDGFSDVAVLHNGVGVTGSGSDSATIDQDNGLDVRWRFPGSGGRHEFVATYRAAAVLFRSGHRGRLAWPIAPLTPAMNVPATTVTLTLPPGVSIYDGPRIVGEGWQSSPPGAVTTFQKQSSPAHESATLVAEFSVDTFSIPEPQWQRHADRSSELMPAWVSSGIFILVSAWGALFMLRLHYRSTPIDDAQARAAEQALVVRGLRVAGISVVVFGVLCALAVPWLMSSFGRWPYVLPASIVVAGLWLIVAGMRFRMAAPAGVPQVERSGQ